MFTKESDDSADVIKKIYFRNYLGYTRNALRTDEIYHAAKLFEISNKKLEVLYSRFGIMRKIANAEKKRV